MTLEEAIKKITEISDLFGRSMIDHLGAKLASVYGNAGSINWSNLIRYGKIQLAKNDNGKIKPIKINVNNIIDNATV